MNNKIQYQTVDENGYKKEVVKAIQKDYKDAIKNGERFDNIEDALDSLYK